MPSNQDFDPAILQKLEALEAKYAAMGQDLSAYLDGLLHADFLTYWDYINLDTLLSLQHPITPFPDESIFIVYHQITELYFKLVLHELEQLAEEAPRTSASLFGTHSTRQPLFRGPNAQFRNHGRRDGPRSVPEIPDVPIAGERFSECPVSDD